MSDSRQSVMRRMVIPTSTTSVPAHSRKTIELTIAVHVTIGRILFVPETLRIASIVIDHPMTGSFSCMKCEDGAGLAIVDLNASLSSGLMHGIVAYAGDHLLITVINPHEFDVEAVGCLLSTLREERSRT